MVDLNGNAQAYEKAQRYLREILEINKTTNLTRITSDEGSLLLHLEDSLVGLPEVEKAPDGLFADLGSGGGFPGVPLALYAERPVLLVDSVKKKMNAVQSAADKVGLQGLVSTYGGRIEELSLEHPGEFGLLTARALARLAPLMELSAPLLKQGGVLVCYKGSVQPDEREEALALQETLGMKLASERETMLSDRETHRTIVVFEKVAEPLVNLPRRNGMAQKKPLKPKRC